MTDEQFNKLIKKIDIMTEAINTNNETQKNILNLFLAYSTEEFLADEELRSNFKEG